LLSDFVSDFSDFSDFESELFSAGLEPFLP